MVNLRSCRCLAVGARLARPACLQELLQSHRLVEWNLVVSNPRALIVPEHELTVVLPDVQRFLPRHAGQRK